jgi:hypothetical protein
MMFIIINAWVLATLCGIIGFEAGIIYAMLFYKSKP